MFDYPIPCGVSAELRRYESDIDRASERQERYEQELEERTLEIMDRGEFASTLAAVDEMLSERGEETHRRLSAALTQGPEAFGVAIMSETYNYMQSLARKQAERELMQERE